MKRVLSIGQCLADHGAVSRTIEDHFDAEVVSVDHAIEALNLLRDGEFDLVLVNRVFDADGASGLELIRQLKADKAMKPVPVMLVSNYDEVQEQAVGLGAERGFGKAMLSHPRMVGLLKPFLGEPANTPQL